MTAYGDPPAATDAERDVLHDPVIPLTRPLATLSPLAGRGHSLIGRLPSPRIAGRGAGGEGFVVREPDIAELDRLEMVDVETFVLLEDVHRRVEQLEDPLARRHP